MFTINKINFKNQGRTISYDYDIDYSILKYFNNKESFYVTYQEDVSSLPESINIIPLLANIIPIAWFVGFDVYVDELDETFYKSLQNLKEEFLIHFPQIKLKSNLYVNSLVKNMIPGNNKGLLFSGGLDSFESLTRNIDFNPYLISVLGADIEINDKRRWSDFKKFNNEEKIINTKRLLYVESNLRTFYTYKVDLLVGVSWWGKIQHGMALITLIAPLSVLYGIKTVLIASSNTGEVSFGWGSTFETDEKVKWADQQTVHDGFHLRRTEKIQKIVDFANRKKNYINLRVCYSEWREGYNCSKCTKCQRTILGIILCGENPNNYGFDVPGNFYDLIFENFQHNTKMTIGVSYEWRCLQEKATQVCSPFIIENEHLEKIKIKTFSNLEIQDDINKENENTQKLDQIKFILINKFKFVFKYYLQMRKKLNSK
ncbi:hypothetical protein [Tenacibaculum crassostreae]|uniref:hypothetical protein n=1 Tax=Tenacibaculum crassostreae TaxID=502683 RepID=UPI0038962D4B